MYVQTLFISHYSCTFETISEDKSGLWTSELIFNRVWDLGARMLRN